jgi:hypothetical protein
LKSQYFKYPALLPPLIWLNNDVPPAPTNVKVERDGEQLVITWKMPRNTEETFTYTIYYSRSNSVKTNVSQNILVTGLRETEVLLSIDSSKEQELTFRVSASNRYHIESRPSHEVYYYLSRYDK